MNSAQRAPQRFNFPFVGDFLALGHFDQFEHFLHLVERLLEHFNNPRHFFSCPADGGSWSFGFGFGRQGHLGRRTGRRNRLRAARAASTTAAVATPASAARTAGRRGLARYGWLFIHHGESKHGATPDNCNTERVCCDRNAEHRLGLNRLFFRQAERVLGAPTPSAGDSTEVSGCVRGYFFTNSAREAV
jgi:hypothetical protein